MKVFPGGRKLLKHLKIYNRNVFCFCFLLVYCCCCFFLRIVTHVVTVENMWHNGALCNCFSILAHLRPHWAVAHELTLLLNNIGVNARGCSIFSIICPVYLPSLLSKPSQPVLSKPLCLTYSFLIL